MISIPVSIIGWALFLWLMWSIRKDIRDIKTSMQLNDSKVKQKE